MTEGTSKIPNPQWKFAGLKPAILSGGRITQSNTYKNNFKTFIFIKIYAKFLFINQIIKLSE